MIINDDIFADLPEDDRMLLVSIPYRAGAWVSQADVSGGDQSDEQEKQALNNIIKAFAYDVYSSDIVQQVISVTIKEEKRWDLWFDEIETVPRECEQAVSILYKVADPKEITAFKIYVMQIAEAVALAYREDNNLPPVKKFMRYVSYLIGKSKSSQMSAAYNSFDDYLNISQKERHALERLAQSLQISYG